jgi:DNA primase
MSDAEFQQLVQRARERHNLSDIVGRHTKLKKRGRELIGLCCFHHERTPSLEVNDAKGFYHCFGCGSHGDAIQFLVQKDGLSFMDALKTLLGDEFPVVSEEERAKRKAEDAQLTAERIALGRSIWVKRVRPEDTPAEVYARSRGITMPLPPTVGFVMTPRWRNPETGEVGRDFPAMACALQDVTGAVVGVQCIFLADGGRRKYERVRQDGTKAKAKLTFGQLVGSAFRLGPAREHIIGCEGPEDAMTLAQRLPDRSVWSSCGTANLWQMQFPPEVGSVCFAGDNGTAGRNAVATAVETALSRGLKPSDTFPPPEFKDWNDELRGIRT